MAHDIIQRAGGDESVAAACGISTDALRKWRELGRVPPKHWSMMAELADAPLDEVAAARFAIKRTPLKSSPKKRRAA